MPQLKYIKVAIPLPIDELFEYQVPEQLTSNIEIGKRVKIPFGKKLKKTGFIVEILNESSLKKIKDIKNIIEVIDSSPIVSNSLIKLAKWIAQYYFCPLGEVIQAMIPEKKEKINIKFDKIIKLKVPIFSLDKIILSLKKSSLKQIELLTLLKEKKGEELLSNLVSQYKIPYSTIKNLLQKEYIVIQSKERIRSPLKKDFLSKEPFFIPTLEQKKTLELIYKSIDDEKFETILLHGITNSGKTEVYLQAINYLKRKNKTAIVLVPEISLINQLIERFQKKLKEKIAVLHSKLSKREKFDQWRTIKNGEAKIVIGTRSAIFAPLKNLGLIIIDEEHENSYKQIENPKYNARDTAIKRGQIENAVVILGSATPSLEAYYLSSLGKIKLIEMKKRIFAHSFPDISVVNMCNQKEEIISSILYKAIYESLSKKEQIILFLNRRGFTTYLLCHQCGYVFQCRNCHISLVYHFKEKNLQCHYCNYTQKVFDKCKQCGNPEVKHYGVGTQKVEEVLKKIFPFTKIARLDTDTARRKEMINTILNLFKQRKIDILLGTQMIAKGLDFPLVTLIGVINADTAFNLPDFRASERTFQLLTQVVSLTGRSKKKGKVIIQTYNPNHYAIMSAKNHDYKGFYNKEILLRKELGYPPFRKMIKIEISGPDEQKVIQKTKELEDQLKNIKNNAFLELNILGPVASFFSKIKGEYRWQVLLLGEDFSKISQFIKNISFSLRTYKIKINIDVDPFLVM